MKLQSNYCFTLRLSVTLIVAQITVSYLTNCNAQAATAEEQEIFQHYRPLAMDESVKIVSAPLKSFAENSLLDRKEDLISSSDDGIVNLLEVIDKSEKVDDISSYSRKLESKETSDVLIRVSDSSGKNVSENLFALPDEVEGGSVALTKLITGKQVPTFAQKLVEPTLIEKSDKTNKRKILASYNIVVPVFIPGLKPLTSKAPVARKFVTETKTKLVPVRKNVPQINTYFKAERIPQQVITDYVKADGTEVPSNVDDELKPNEKLLTSVLTNYN